MAKVKIELEMDLKEVDTLHAFLKRQHSSLMEEQLMFKTIDREIPEGYLIIIKHREETMKAIGEAIEQIEEGLGMK